MIKGKDMLLLEDGSTYHLGVKKGDVYPRILIVGPHQRADSIASLLDKVEAKFVSGRDFQIIKGVYKGVGVNIIAIGMGGPMVDFMVRETSYVCPERMACIRVGTCGLFNPEFEPGTVVTAGKGSTMTYINHAAFAGGLLTGTVKEADASAGASAAGNYIVSKPVQGDAELHKLLLAKLTEAGVQKCCEGLNNSADTFFACQGRIDPHFDDRDSPKIVDILRANHVDTCEMETYFLFNLARQRTTAHLAAAACHIGIVNRTNPKMVSNISKDELKALELNCGKAALEALIAYKL